MRFAEDEAIAKGFIKNKIFLFLTLLKKPAKLYARL